MLAVVTGAADFTGKWVNYKVSMQQQCDVKLE
jgi:hypothetical protein